MTGCDGCEDDVAWAVRGGWAPPHLNACQRPMPASRCWAGLSSMYLYTLMCSALSTMGTCSILPPPPWGAAGANMGSGYYASQLRDSKERPKQSALSRPSERGASGFESGFHGGDPANTHAGSERVQVRRQRKVQSGPVLGAHTHLHLPGRLARAVLESSLTAGRQGSPLQRGGGRDMRTEENPSCGPRGHAARAVKRADGLSCQNSLPPFARRNVKHS